jgi:hypothetical protein
MSEETSNLKAKLSTACPHRRSFAPLIDAAPVPSVADGSPFLAQFEGRPYNHVWTPISTF